MKLKWLLFFSIILFTACGLSEREHKIQQKQRELEARQETLMLLEQQLVQKEQMLVDRERRLDSTKRGIDSVVIHGPSVTGAWQVEMQCVETSCPGSALGDIKTEQWVIGKDSSGIIVNVFVNKNMTRTYRGKYTHSGMALIDNNSVGAGTIEVTLRMLNEKKMDGIREIKLPNCKTTYSIKADKL